jgi:hypothetical protein
LYSLHEIKHDGYRLQVRRKGDSVRLFTRRGYDWSARYPAIVRTAAQLKARSFTLDGEAVVCGPDGIAIFDALHRHGTVRALAHRPLQPVARPSHFPDFLLLSSLQSIWPRRRCRQWQHAPPASSAAPPLSSGSPRIGSP